ncbi:LOW QUALITY PROTEIN: hypothetical protein Cgig2_027458 [Carnegiea gigantea]|uniref:Reverse transcriptase n=1 Tax=Carnegiea gigantea TaxID=171969 RepID=A0A9Q1KPI8_9CARY|nr:LOW QUALITY PROTEIN: hypothetical protein Cgig2_027458 [Carnegiea gigantea]
MDQIHNISKLSIFMYNVQGAANRNFLFILRVLIRNHDPKILILKPRLVARWLTNYVEKSILMVCAGLKQRGFECPDEQLEASSRKILAINNSTPGFNDTKSIDERVNCGQLSKIPQFTWTRGLTPETHKCARLDGGLCTIHWRCKFPEAGTCHLLQSQSDHCPLLLATTRFDQAAWLSHTSFEQFLKDYWKHSQPLYPQLNHLPKALDDWNKWVFRNLFTCRKETLWFQKSCKEAIRNADKNTWFYLIFTIVRRRDQISKCKDDGGMGLQSMRQMNSAFLTKLGWRLLAECDKLWDRVMRVK